MKVGFAEIVDRIFWSAVVAIFVGLVWLKFVDPKIEFFPSGLLVVLLVGLAWFFVWWRKVKRELQGLEEADG